MSSSQTLSRPFQHQVDYHYFLLNTNNNNGPKEPKEYDSTKKQDEEERVQANVCFPKKERRKISRSISRPADML